MKRRTIRRGGIALMIAALTISACSSSGSGSKAAPTSAIASTTTVARPIGPAAEVGTISGGKGTLLLSPKAGPDLAKVGYVQDEYSVSGTATAYKLSGGEKTFPKNGKMNLEPTTKAKYKTRIVVRRPKNAAKFNGTVVVEWNNVSGGLDVAPDWTYTADEITRSGYAWVGVSAQFIGIEGGPVAVATPVSKLGGAGLGIKHQDPARYGSLHHPGDAYSYDIYTQVARALRANSGAVKPLGDLKVKTVLAMGESQSAYALTTYYDGVQPLTHEFDGFLVHSRGGSALGLGEPGKGMDITGAVTDLSPVQFRTDLTKPVLTVLTETDVAGILQYYPARQPDNAHLRIWEVAGTAHVDIYQLGDGVAKLFKCPKGVNAGPDNFIVGAALAKLNLWATKDTTPAKAARLETTKDGKGYVLDDLGIAKGGIRTPQVDVPVDVLSGLPPKSDSLPLACFLAGTTTPIPTAKLASLYPSRAAYLDKFTKATDAAIAAGFVLPADRKAMLADAQPTRIAN